METVGYCIRVQAFEGYGEKITMLPATEDYDAVLAVRHVGSKKENTHYHIVIRTNVKAQALRVRLRKLFPDGSGNGHMSIKHWDGDDRALSYLFHELEPEETATLLANKGFSDQRLSELRAQNDSIKKLVEASKGKASWTLEEDVYQDLKKDPNMLRHDSAIGTEILYKALRLGKYPPQPWLVRAMVARIQFRLFDGDVNKEYEFCQQMAKNIFYDDR